MGFRIFVPLISFLAIIFLCCGPAAELMPAYMEKTPTEIVGDYSLGKPALSGLRLYGKAYKCSDDPQATCYPTIVEQSVVKIGWDENFILVERHPLDTVIFATPDATNPSWHIVVLSSNTLYKNLSYEEFTGLITTLEIPQIKMQDAIDIYR